MKEFAFQPHHHFMYLSFEVRSRKNGSNWCTRPFDDFSEARKEYTYRKDSGCEVRLIDTSSRRSNCPGYEELGMYMDPLEIC